MNNCVVINKGKYSELSHYQRTLLIFEKLYPQSDINNMGGIINIKSPVNISFLDKAINLCILKHPQLRSVIIKNHGNIYQYIKDYEYEKIDIVDFSESNNIYNEFQIWSKKVLRKSFKLENSKLNSFHIFKLNAYEYGILFKINKIISDRHGINIICRDIRNLYDKISKNKIISTYSKHSFFDFKNKEDLYIKSMDFIKDKMYWNNKLCGISNQLNFCEYEISEVKREALYLDKELYYKLKTILMKNRISIKTFFTMVIRLYTLFKSNERYIVIGIMENNRYKKKENFSLGVYSNIIFLKFEIDYNETLLDSLNRLEMNLKKDTIHSRYPYDILLNDFNIKKYGYNDFCLLEYDLCSYDQEYDWSFEQYINEFALVPLQININESLKFISINIDYMKNSYDHEDINKINEYLLKCSSSLLNGRRVLISDLLS